ncbi:MAG: 2Fe-2S iron-sulfur cluster-binding protein [Chroococcales cyanobacterium]
MSVYKVRLINPNIGLDFTLNVPETEYIFDIADMAGIRLPSGCLQGQCSACVAKVVKGSVNQREQKFLRPSEIEAGYTVTCVAYPQSDCTLLTHQEEVLYKNALYAQKELKNSNL